MFALSSVAALMIGLAALLVVSYNWQALSAVQKLAVIFGALLGLHGVGFALRYGGRWRLSSEIVFFVACILYGSAIWLIAQIFHIQSHYPDGLWLWALGVLPFALCLDTLLMHALYAGLLALWVGTEILGFHDVGFHGSMFLRGCAATLPLLALPGLWWAYRKRSATTVGLYAPLLAWWAVLQPVAWQWEVDPVYFVGLAGAIFLLIAEMHRAGSPLAKPYRLYGVLISGGVLVPLSFADFIINLLHRSPAVDHYVAGLVIGLIGAVAALGVFLWQQRYGTLWCRRLACQGSRDGCTTSRHRRAICNAVGPTMVAVGAGVAVGRVVLLERTVQQIRPAASLVRIRLGFTHDMEKWTPQVLLPVAAAMRR